jgi:cell fate regulator YaaT (PSP1 superfamily)
MQIVGVKFKPVGEIEYFNAGNLELKKDEAVICETENGLMFGIVEIPSLEQDTSGEYKKVIRVATDGDKKKLNDIHQKEKEALQTTKKLAKQHGLEMKLIDAEYSFDMNKITFSFTAEGRVDFRDLLKSLAGEFRTRIELKQIGARDETKIVGGYGPCGRPLCCANHLRDFGKVSIKMAKDQGLSLNPTGINGMCNRLLCCLQYEENDYSKALQNMPKLNSKVKTPDGEGVVTFNNVLKDEVSVKFINEDGSYSIRDYALGEIQFERKHEEQ